MKLKKSCFSIIKCILPFLILFSSVLPAINAGASTEIQAFGNGDHSAYQVTSGTGVLGVHLKINEEFDSVSFCMPTWGVSGKYTAYISVYKWNKNYNDTMKDEPLATKQFKALSDNAINRFSFTALPEGEYFICIEKTEGQVGCWVRNGNSVSHGLMIIDGVESTKEPELRIGFAGSVPSQPFSDVESGDSSYGDAPSYEEMTGDMRDISGYELPSDSLYHQNKVMPDTWVFVDGLGRKSLTYEDVGGPREDKNVIIFYSDWHDSFSTGNKPFNVQQFLDAEEKKGTDLNAIKNDYSYSGWPKSGYQNFWNKPIWGYYSTADKWVLRKQAELLANAGIDAISTDNTNGTYTWKSSYDAIFKTWTQAQKDGVNSPKLTYMLPFGGNSDTNTQLSSLYLDVYRDGNYRSLWFYLDGKPLIMAHKEALQLSTNKLHSEIASFFSFRSNYPGYIDSSPSLGAWGWLSVFPQAVYYKSSADRKAGIAEQITVGVAQNHNYVTHTITSMNGYNVTDRTYTSKGYDTRENAKLYGANFAEQWGRALKIDPKVVYVTGWNEWIAGRYESWAKVPNAFPDEYNDIASRDIEPSRGELRDHYYYQLVNFVRQYKGVNELPAASEAKVIDITAGTSQWADVAPYYAAYIGNTGDREYHGYVGYNYADYSGRNDIIGTQMARDGEYIYILVECAKDITPYTDSLWMNVLLDTKEEGGWEGFDFVINKTTPKDASTAVLERFTGNGYESEYVTDVSMNIDGRYLQLAVKKTDLGISGNDYTINYSVTDNVHDLKDVGTFKDGKVTYTDFTGDILDFYTSGDVAPGGRFMYSYISTTDNTGTLPETTAEETTAPAPVKKGCGSSASALAATVTAAGCGVLLASKKKKKED